MHISPGDEPTLAAEERLLQYVGVRGLEGRERGCLGRGDERGEEWFSQHLLVDVAQRLMRSATMPCAYPRRHGDGVSVGAALRSGHSA